MRKLAIVTLVIVVNGTPALRIAKRAGQSPYDFTRGWAKCPDYLVKRHLSVEIQFGDFVDAMDDQRKSACEGSIHIKYYPPQSSAGIGRRARDTPLNIQLSIIRDQTWDPSKLC